MRAVIQRVNRASVTVHNEVVGKIDTGLFVLLGYEESDDETSIEWLLKKILSMRIFSDAEGKMNLSVEDVSGGLLMISQFTLHASTKKGNRPSFIKAARPEKAEGLYNLTIARTKELFNGPVETGRFGEHMIIDAQNDGPVTITMDTANKE